MKLNLFDSFKNKIARIEVCSNEVINIYLCGPTVHDHVHIGNLRPVIVFDVIYRLLLHLNIKVNYVQNITDIDDKITIKALKEQKNEKEISNYYIQSYLINLSRYNIIIPTHLLRVTDYISQLQEFIKALLEKGFAYQEAGEIFFRVKKTQEYGKLSGQNIARLKSGLRKIASANKEDNKDFVL